VKFYVSEGVAGHFLPDTMKNFRDWKRAIGEQLRMETHQPEQAKDSRAARY